MLICPSCYHQNPPNVEKCKQCGKKLSILQSGPFEALVLEKILDEEKAPIDKERSNIKSASDFIEITSEDLVNTLQSKPPTPSSHIFQDDEEDDLAALLGGVLDDSDSLFTDDEDDSDWLSGSPGDSGNLTPPPEPKEEDDLALALMEVLSEENEETSELGEDLKSLLLQPTPTPEKKLNIKGPVKLKLPSTLPASDEDHTEEAPSPIRSFSQPQIQNKRRQSNKLLDILKPQNSKSDPNRNLSVEKMPLSRADNTNTGIRCPTCFNLNPNQMYYCVHCGSSLLKTDGPTPSSITSGVTSTACPTCGTTNPASNKFCGTCGEVLTAPKEPPKVLDLSVKVRRGVRLVSINDDGTDGVELEITHKETIIGRSADTRFPTDAFLSPKHSRLTIENEKLFIEDLYSLNGTFLKLREDVPLKAGDCFLMGRQVLRFERFEQTISPKARSSDGTRYMGSPPPGGKYKVVQVGVGGVIQNVYCLPDAGVILGRERGDILFLNDKYLSARHAQIFSKDDGHYYLVDLNSSNGTWIRLWEKHELRDKDFVFLGQQLFRIEILN